MAIQLQLNTRYWERNKRVDDLMFRCRLFTFTEGTVHIIEARKRQISSFVNSYIYKQKSAVS